jgi:hypothetical protein
MRAAPQGAAGRRAPSRSRSGRARLPRAFLLFLIPALLASCGVLPDEFNISPLYRHRIGPEGQVQEVDVLWPLVHWERNPETGGSDTRLRPVWRKQTIPARDRVEHQFLAPLGDAYEDPEESKLSLFPFWYYRKHLEMGQEGAWDIDWNVLYLLYGGYAADGENYLGLLPFYGKLRDFLTYDEFGWFLFPLHVWWRKGTAKSDMYLWPLISWGDDGQEGGAHWFRFLPFYGESIRPGKSASHSLLWPFFHWDYQLTRSGRVDGFFFWPFFGWSLGPRYRLWTWLWPLFRYGYEIAEEGAEPRYWQLDAPFPFVRYRWDDTTSREITQQWFFPLFGHTTTTTKDALSVLFPIGWFETWEDATSRHEQTLILPFYYDIISRRKKAQPLVSGLGEGSEEDGQASAAGPPSGDALYEEGRLRRLRFWPLFSKREQHDGSWSWQFLDLWPYDGDYAYGINEAYDWVWVLAEQSGDARGNSRFRSFANLYSSRNFAGRRFQSSVPFLFNYVEDEDGKATLRLLQCIPIRWGGDD